MQTVIPQIPKYPGFVCREAKDANRLIAIGDIHGCYSEFIELFGKLHITDKDIVIFLGDLVDRGPFPNSVVSYVKDLSLKPDFRFDCVLGNHEEKHVRYRIHELRKLTQPGYKNPMRPFQDVRMAEHNAITDQEMQWLASLPAAIVVNTKFGTRTFCHAGMIDGLEFNQPTSGFIRNRYVNPVTKTFATFKFNGQVCEKPEGAVFWDEIWTGGRVIYGHIVHSLEEPRVVNDCYGVDTGACFGGRLSAYVEDLSTGVVTFEQVEASPPTGLVDNSE